MPSDQELGTGRSPYGAAGRADLQDLADQVTAQSPDVMTLLGPQIAGKLRKKLPDMSDLDIGRVLVAVGTELVRFFVPGHEFQWGGLAAAGLLLTEEEWKTP